MADIDTIPTAEPIEPPPAPSEPSEPSEPSKADEPEEPVLPTPNATDAKANDPVDKLLDEEEKIESGAAEDIARASNSILTKLQDAQGSVAALRQKGHQLESVVVEFEQWVGNFVAKLKSHLSGTKPSGSAGA